MHKLSTMLYLVATPIGNLGDITYRAVEILKSCDYILCEDTRHSLRLLQHYSIQKHMISYHMFNEASREKRIIEDIQAGKLIALISDAGTPGIADPGMRLVKKCREENIKVESIPGPCAAIAAVTCSGMSTERFQFWGFLPRTSGRLKTQLEEILTYSGTTICYETPHRLLKVLEVLKQIAPERKITVTRELTKKFEEVISGTPEELLLVWKDRAVKGEIVLLI
jgi:16S rRNA (cytidine1402-2'-O)-methyltransferase